MGTLIRRAALHALLFVVAALVLFGESVVSAPAPGWLRAVILEVRAVCRDPGTQWMVFLCAGIYFLTFTVLGARAERRRSAAPGFQHVSVSVCQRFRLSFHQLSAINFFNPDWFLCALLLIAAFAYALDYERASTSTQALMLLAGATIGKAARLWANWEGANCGLRTVAQASQPAGSGSIPAPSSTILPAMHPTTPYPVSPQTGDTLQPSTCTRLPFEKPETWNLKLGTLLAVLLLLLATASLWHPEGAMQFQYRGLNRWSGPWDNPNIFGLLMGVGVVLACGLAVARFKFHVSSLPVWRRWVWRMLLLGCAGSCAIGLLKSYSRGAWLGAAVGLAVLGFRVIRFQVSGSECQPLTPSLSPSVGERVAEGRVREGFSLGSCISWLKRNWRPLSVVMLSVVVLAFWQFRHTEFHPVRRAFSVGNQNDFSWRNRVAAWEGSLAMMADRPIAGFGWNQPERVYDQFYRPAKVSEGMAIQLNHYFTLGMSLGLPALICFGLYAGLSLVPLLRGVGVGSVQGSKFKVQRFKVQRFDVHRPPGPGSMVTWSRGPASVCHAAALVLLIGLWFDGGLFNMATGALLWTLVELGRVGRVTPCAPFGKPIASLSRRSCVSRLNRIAVPTFVAALLLTGLLWAKARDPFRREWLSLQTPEGGRFSSVAVMPDRGGPFPVLLWCHGSGGSAESSGETLRQFAGLGLAAVGIEYDKTNQAGFDAQFAVLLDEIARQPWAQGNAVRQRTANRPGGHPFPGAAFFKTNTERQIDNASQTNLPPTPHFTPVTPHLALVPNLQPATCNLQLPIAWVGNSLGAQRQLSFLIRHPERQPAALVRLNGGWVEELETIAESGNPRSADLRIGKSPPTANPTEPAKAVTEENLQLSTSNLQPSAERTPVTRHPPRAFRAFRAWLAHGANDEVFPAGDARKVAEALRAAGAEVRLDIFPGRGHGFGEDQPLLVKAAAELCARELGGTTPVPVNVRPALWYFWLPAGLLGGVLIVQRMRLRTRPPHPTFGPPLPVGWGEGRGEGLVGSGHRRDRGLKIFASLTLIAATLVSAAHLALPLLRATPPTLKLARHWCVRPELRADFNWLTQQPGAKAYRVRALLEHLNLASLQRGQFAASLPESEWREFVLSPWIECAGEDISWRRELWETIQPRVRRETDAPAAAQTVARCLRLRVSVNPNATQDGGASGAWNSGITSPTGFERLYVAALRSVGIPARLSQTGMCEFQSASQWQAAPRPLLEDQAN